MSTIASALADLEQERVRITHQLAALTNALAALNAKTPNSVSRPRRLSAAARAKIAAAQRARWARVKGQKVVPITAGKKKRKLSTNALAHIRAAQKKRWALWRKQQKSA
jgi:hypothetical protein